MKKFLLQFFYFSLFPLTLIGIFEISISCYHSSFFSEKRLEKLFLNEITEYKWLSLLETDTINLLAGSSSVKYGISCSQLNTLNQDSNCYVNIAMDARDPIATYFIIKHLKGKKIEAIYMGLDPWIFAKQYYKSRNSYFYLDLNFWQIIRFTLEHDNSAFLQRYKEVLAVILNEKPIISKMKRGIPDDFGSVALTQIPKNFNQKPSEMFQLKSYGWSDLQFTYLKKITEYCKANQIPFYLFVPPKRSDFTASYRKDCAEIHSDFLHHLEEKGITEPIFGTFDQKGLDGNPNYFVDGFHLNQQGQKRYTEIFYRLTNESKSHEFTN